MAYSMFECPKLHNTKSLKFYPEDMDHHVSFRHKNLPSDFELTGENFTQHHVNHFVENETQNYSVQAQSSKHKKCPIYVHNFNKVRNNEGDFVPKNRKFKKKHKTIEKLEETYWANWKPEKEGALKKNSTPPVVKTKSPEIQIIKSAPDRRKKIQVFPLSDDEIEKTEKEIVRKNRVKKKSSRSQEIQTDDILTIKVEKSSAPIIEESVQEIENLKIDEAESKVENSEVDEAIDNKFLKHTDSFILNVKKQQEEKEPCDQPKCIRLYKKAGRMSSSKNFIKGGTYTLKSCLKTDSSFGKNTKNSRPVRPGSPLIVSSTFSNKRGKTRR